MFSRFMYIQGMAKTARIGRPPKPPGELKRLSQVRMTESERQLVASAAHRVGETFSQFVRVAALARAKDTA